MNHKTDMQAELKRVASELRTYNPAADEYKGEHIHKVWAREIEAALASRPDALVDERGAFQSRVHPWMLACFGAAIAADRIERNHRFFEEAAELVQACGMEASEAHQLVDYTWSRPVGERNQEAGGVMVTLAALCLAQGLDMHAAGETELARISAPETIAKIRAKQAAKPKHSPLPEARAAAPQAEAQGVALAVEIRPIVMAGSPDACQVWLRHSNGQQFTVGNPHETRADGEWFADQLHSALSMPSQDREQVGAAETEQSIAADSYFWIAERIGTLDGYSVQDHVDIGWRVLQDCADYFHDFVGSDEGGDDAAVRIAADLRAVLGGHLERVSAALEGNADASPSRERGERPVEPNDIDAVAEAIQRETSVEWETASRAAVAAIDTLIARGNHASARGEQDCPHGVDDGACKQCYGAATNALPLDDERNAFEAWAASKGHRFNAGDLNHCKSWALAAWLRRAEIAGAHPKPMTQAQPVYDKSVVRRLATQWGMIPETDAARDVKRWREKIIQSTRAPSRGDFTVAINAILREMTDEIERLDSAKGE